MLSIASWTCQGDPTEHSLSTGFLQRLLTDHDLVVLHSCGALVQTSVEAVSDVTVGRIRCSIRGLRQAISVDPDSSVAILSRLGSAFPLAAARMLECGVAGRFGVACTVPVAEREILVAALHDASDGIGRSALRQFHASLSALAAAGQPVLIAARIDASVEPGEDGLALVDHRGIVHPSPGRRHDSFGAVGMVPSSPAGGLVDAGGASDHDATWARFGLQNRAHARIPAGVTTART